MFYLARSGSILLTVVVIFTAGGGPAAAQELPESVCSLVIHDELSELGDARIAVSLARSNFDAYLKIYEMIEGLWKAEAIGRMLYVEARHDRDAAIAALEEADLLLLRQTLLVKQYQRICELPASGTDTKEQAKAVQDLYLLYRRADCDSLSKAIDVAAINLEFHREFLVSVLDLRAGSVATKTDVILARLEVEREEKRHTDAKNREESCREKLAGLGGMKP